MFDVASKIITECVNFKEQQHIDANYVVVCICHRNSINSLKQSIKHLNLTIIFSYTMDADSVIVGNNQFDTFKTV